MSQQKSGDGAKTSKYDDICPICGKNRQENPDCRKKAKLNLCPAKDEQCHNNHKKTIDGLVLMEKLNSTLISLLRTEVQKQG